MSARFHLAVPTAPRPAATLPGFITDIRPGDRLREPRSAARAAQLTGLSGILVPFDPAGLESLVTSAGLLRASQALQVTAEFHPAIASPVYAAKLSASVQRFSANRLAWKLRVDVPPETARAQGDFLEAVPGRYARADEFLTIAKGVWSTDGYTHEGRFYSVLGGGFPRSRSAPRFPRVYLSGTSPEALKLSAAHADVHVLTSGDDPGLVPAGVAAGLALRVLAREDAAEAERDAERLGFAGDIVGSFDDAAAALSDYAAGGVSEFFLQTPDPVADGYLIGQHVLPLLASDAQEAAHVG